MKYLFPTITERISVDYLLTRKNYCSFVINTINVIKQEHCRVID